MERLRFRDHCLSVASDMRFNKPREFVDLRAPDALASSSGGRHSHGRRLDYLKTASDNADKSVPNATSNTLA
jgi:hypothetical protein